MDIEKLKEGIDLLEKLQCLEQLRYQFAKGIINYHNDYDAEEYSQIDKLICYAAIEKITEMIAEIKLKIDEM